MRRGLKPHLTRRVVVHTKDDRSIRGLLAGDHADSVTVAQAEYLHEAQETPVAGDVLVLKSNVSFVQVLTD